MRVTCHLKRNISIVIIIKRDRYNVLFDALRDKLLYVIEITENIV